MATVELTDEELVDIIDSLNDRIERLEVIGMETDDDPVLTKQKTDLQRLVGLVLSHLDRRT